MKIERFQYFAEVARLGSITAAARKCYISQTAMSQQMSALEEDLGVCLLERTKTGTKLTEEGKILLPKAEALIEAYQEILGCFAAGKKQEAKLTIAYTGPMEQQLLLAAVPVFHRVHPEIDVQLRQCSMAAIGEELENNECDIALAVHGEIRMKGCHHAEVLRRPICVAVSAKAALENEKMLTMEQLKKRRFVVLRPDASTRTSKLIHQWLISLGWQESMILYADNIESQLLMVSLGEGITLMPEGIYPPGIRLVPFADKENFVHRTEAVWKGKSSLCEEMIHLLQKEAQKCTGRQPDTEKI